MKVWDTPGVKKPMPLGSVENQAEGLIVKFPLTQESKDLQHCFDDHKGEPTTDESQSNVQQPEKNRIFVIPLPFKG